MLSQSSPEIGPNGPNNLRPLLTPHLFQCIGLSIRRVYVPIKHIKALIFKKEKKNKLIGYTAFEEKNLSTPKVSGKALTEESCVSSVCA